MSFCSYVVVNLRHKRWFESLNYGYLIRKVTKSNEKFHCQIILLSIIKDIEIKIVPFETCEFNKIMNLIFKSI